MSEKDRVKQAIERYFKTKDPVLRSVTIVRKMPAGVGNKTRLWVAEVDVEGWDPGHYALCVVSYRYVLGTIVVYRDALPKLIGVVWQNEDKRRTAA